MSGRYGKMKSRKGKMKASHRRGKGQDRRNCWDGVWAHGETFGYVGDQGAMQGLGLRVQWKEGQL